ncbi:MAG: methyltransferase [Methanosarcinales archaeon]|nr:methyltransferase [Methanosarcinales archaeon]
MKCPTCEKDCLQPAAQVLSGIDSLYMACPRCPPEPNLDKGAPLRELPRTANRCPSCGRAPLDLVMLEALDVMVECGIRDAGESLRSVGTPLVEIGFPMAYPPRLGGRSLIIVGDRLTGEAASRLMEIPEIKGVIQSAGIPGVVDRSRGSREGELLAGCDLRADLVQSAFGDLLIYKSQARIHIEFSRQGAPKVRIVESLFFGGAFKEVVDGYCGPGTLGLVCALAGAKRVVLNDIWLPAVENVMMNLEANRDLLGIQEIQRPEAAVSLVGGSPVLVGLATGDCRIEVYHGDLRKLFHRAGPADLCLIDPFPGSDTREAERACSSCRKIVII